MFAANRMLTSRCLLGAMGKHILKQTRSITHKGYWPEPITQQTLEQFLDDIDYFEQPKKFINIGLRLDESKTACDATPARDETGARSDELQGVETVNVDHLLDMLGQDIDLPELDLDDTRISKEQLKNLAITYGIYRDLFGEYQPKREQISFTPDQANRMAKLVPHYWISDQPHARADRHLRKTDPLVYFEPVVRVSARFVHSLEGEEGQYAHTAHYGNIIPASEALIKPSITIDYRDLPDSGDSSAKALVNDSDFKNWTPGQVTGENLPTNLNSSPYFSILLLNLDYIHQNSANLHWMITNMKPSADGTMTYEEVCDYLPVHGIRGFGYSRYVFLVMQHDAEIDKSDIGLQPESRKFDTRAFIGRNKNINLTPIGLSWFQTTWDESSNRVFHDHLKMRSPVYEHVQEKYEKREMLDMGYPGKIPFNIFMDHYRDPKETNEKVLLERLKTIDPFDYSDQYVPPKVPPTVHVNEDIPSWMNVIMFKKNNKIGPYRGLRPASITIPLNNNADLDHPTRPLTSSKKSLPGHPNLYEGRHRTKPIKNLPYSKPASEHPSIYVQEDHDVHLNKVRKMMENLKKESVKK